MKRLVLDRCRHTYTVHALAHVSFGVFEFSKATTECKERKHCLFTVGLTKKEH